MPSKYGRTNHRQILGMRTKPRIVNGIKILSLQNVTIESNVNGCIQYIFQNE